MSDRGDKMIEVIDLDSNAKMMAMILGKIIHGNRSYVLFGIRRDQENVNLFLCKLVHNSQGLVMDIDFENGEKDAMDKVIQKLLNRVSVEELSKDGFQLEGNVSLEGSQYFDIHKCYVCSVAKGIMKDCMIRYGLVSEKVFFQPLVAVREEKKFFNEGFVGNLFVIFFGIAVLIFCIVIIFFVFID